MSIYGPSGSGKSFFQTHILRQRSERRGTHVVVVATKKADQTLVDMGWPVITKWPPDYGKNQVIYWSKGGLSDEQQAEQAKRIRILMNALWVPDSNRIVAWDELPYVCTDLRLMTAITTYYREGRGLGLTNSAVMQRPTGVSRYTHSEVGWTVAFKPEDQDDRDRVAEVFGNRGFYRDVLDDLDPDKREFLIRRRVTGEVYRSHIAKRRPRRKQ